MQDDDQNKLTKGFFGKESEPIPSSSEAVSLSEEEPVLSREEEEAGVKVIPKEHQIPQEAGEAGLALAKEAVKPSLDPKLNVPMTKQQAQTSSKGGVFNSVTWLATLINMLFKKQEEEK